MPLIVKCHSCGFVLYQGRDLKSLEVILRRWGYRCPCCLSPLADLKTGKITIKRIEITVNSNERLYPR
jgi:Zn finger protein HypA/HybF involved in hydrogenase expression